MWAAGCVSDGFESGVSGWLSCCSVLLVGLALCPVPRGGVELSLIVCTGVDLGGGIPGGLGSCGGGPSDRPSRSLRVAPAGFRPGTRPAHPGPAHRGASAVALQVPGELGGGVLAAPARVESSGIPSLLSCTGTCGPPYRSPRTPGAGAARGRPSGVPDRFLGAAARGRSPDRSGPSPGSDTGGCRPPTSLPGLLAAGAPLDQVGTRDSGPGGPGGGAESFRRGRGLTGPAHARAGAHRPLGGLNSLCGPRRREYGGTRRVARELLRTHSIKALSSSASHGS
ncbi:hypothetical protein AIF0345_2654 [Actinomyces israelii]|nr:hypothetical protein AIF0345_2654 [Actinomyces israelii]